MSSARSLVAVAIVFAIGASPLALASTRLRPHKSQPQAVTPGEGGGSSCAGLRASPNFVELDWPIARVPVSVSVPDGMYCTWEATVDPFSTDWITIGGSAQGMGSATVNINVDEFQSGPFPFDDPCSPRLGAVEIVTEGIANNATVAIDQYPSATAECLLLAIIDFVFNGCTTEMAGAKLPDGGASTRLARRYRDEVLQRTPRGQQYARQYYEFTDEASRIMSANPRLAFGAARLLKRYTPMMAAAVDGRGSAMTPLAAHEIDGFLHELGARATAPLKGALEALRRDLRDPAAARELGFTIDPETAATIGKAHDEGLFSLSTVDPTIVLAAAARGRSYARGGAAQLDEIVDLLTRHPLAAVQLASRMDRFRSMVYEIVDRGEAEITTEEVNAVDDALAAILPDASPKVATLLRAARRDLHDAQALGDYGVKLVGRPRLNDQPAGPSMRTLGSGLGFSTFLGGSNDEAGTCVATDAQGNVYLAGKTDATDFPVAGAIQAAYAGGPSDAFVAKLSPAGQVLYATYLGGGREDFATGIAVDAAGNAYVVGMTNSTNFPTANPLQSSLRGTCSGFLAKLDPSGAALAYSTYLGGSGFDMASGVAVDAAGNAYVAGSASSTNLSRPGGFSQSNRGYMDAFVTKINPTGSAYVYSTYVGGTGFDEATDIAVDGAGNATISGLTSSADYPTKNAAQSGFGGLLDAFVTRIDSAGSTLVYSTYLGGAEPDGATGVALDSDGSVVVAGSTASEDFPLVQPSQTSYGGGMLDAFATRLGANGAILSSTYLGGSDDDRGYRIALDSAGRPLVTGLTRSADFPVAAALQGTLTGDSDAFVAQLGASGSALQFSTYLGGSASDAGMDVAAASDGTAVVLGLTGSSDFPTSSPAQGTIGGEFDAFVARVSTQPGVPPPVIEGVTALAGGGKPFRLKITGSNFQGGVEVFIGDDTEPWAGVKRKNDGQLVLKKGATLEALFPVGVAVSLRLVNPDGGRATTTYTR